MGLHKTAAQGAVCGEVLGLVSPALPPLHLELSYMKDVVGGVAGRAGMGRWH